MKKHRECNSYNRLLEKLLRVMKLTSILILFFVISVSASSYSQSTKLSIQVMNGTFIEVLKQIENQSEFYFYYNKDEVKSIDDVSINVSNMKIEEVMGKLLHGTNLDYKIIDRYIAITKKEGMLLNQTQQLKSVSGKVTDSSGGPLPGVSIVVKGTTNGAITDGKGNYSLSNIPENATLQFSFVGMKTQEIAIAGKTSVNVVLDEKTIGLDEVVAIGYGTQKRSDITGSVASVSSERLEQIPNTNFGQALQGAVPGLTITTNSAGAEGGDMSILVRGRNSIGANNSPLIVLDGIPYSGNISEINPDDISSIEVLKDASAAAIYGSRGSNGVILVATKRGKLGKPTVNYNGFYGIQKIASLPDVLTGPEFWDFKMKRNPEGITESERAIYEAGTWTDWIDEATRTGQKQQHTLSLSGGTDQIKYFISGTYLDVSGVAIGDDFKRYSSRFNFEANVTDWFSIGSNTQLSLTDRSGMGPSWSGDTDGAFYMNPLTKAWDENGKLTIDPWPEDPTRENPLASTLADSKDKTYRVITNNFVTIKAPWIKGLQYKLNTGVEYANKEINSYFGRDTKSGLTSGGRSETRSSVENNYTVENILSYNHDFGKHSIFATALYSFQTDAWEEHRLQAQGFPNDVLTWFQASTANLLTPSSNYQKENITSQMLRFNYGYDSRYLITLTGRRDGFSGFGTNRKWGIFPSVALGWNIANESFFESVDFMNQLKLRGSFGENGNQAVGPYSTLSRMSESSYLDGTATDPGYRPSKLGNPELGWETTRSSNIGIDFGFFKNKISGSIDAFNSDTRDLLLNRSISSVHGISSITENIGKTNNKGIELMLNSNNVSKPNFKWTTSGTFSFTKNKIVSLYGYLDEEGKEVDDLANRWFIGQPILVNFARVFDGIWQLDDDIIHSAQPTAKPGEPRIVDINKDSLINDLDRVVQGQRDPKFLWSFTNILSYRNFNLSIFIHGVNGAKKTNSLMIDDVWLCRRNTTMKNWWTPENPTNDFYSNTDGMQVYGATFIERSDFIRVKDVSLSYDLPVNLRSNIGFNKLRVYVTGRNLLTITNYGGLDPELSSDRDIPLQREYLVGLILGF